MLEEVDSLMVTSVAVFTAESSTLEGLFGKEKLWLFRGAKKGCLRKDIGG